MMMYPGHLRGPHCVPRPSCTDRMHLREVVTVANSWPGSKDGFGAPPGAAPYVPRFLARPSRSVFGTGWRPPRFRFRVSPNVSPLLLKEGSMARKDSKRPDQGDGQELELLPEVSEQAIRELAQVFKLLSDETRLRILFYLALSENRELHVTDLCQRLGQSQPAVSHHLALLRVSGLIESRREGKHNFYSVRTDHFGDLLLSLFSAAGEVPRNKKYKFHDFTLAYTGT